ncbi:hypothetical protein PIB30_074830, partial [Stylosanthes scabra]|nr:hypothetical protein [Stylosanthes scabra]
MDTKRRTVGTEQSDEAGMMVRPSREQGRTARRLPGRERKAALAKQRLEGNGDSDRTLGGGSFVNGDGGIAGKNDGRTFFPFRRVSLSSQTLPSATAMASSMNNGGEVMESDG